MGLDPLQREKRKGIGLKPLAPVDAGSEPAEPTTGALPRAVVKARGAETGLRPLVVKRLRGLLQRKRRLLPLFPQVIAI